MVTVRSKNDVKIRLPDERWLHIIESHTEIGGSLFRRPRDRRGP